MPNPLFGHFFICSIASWCVYLHSTILLFCVELHHDVEDKTQDSACDCDRLANPPHSNRPSIFGPLNSIRSAQPAFKSDGISSCKLNPILALPEAWLWSLGPLLRANTWSRVHTNSGQGLWPTTWKQSRGKRENGGIWNKVSGLARSHRLEK